MPPSLDAMLQSLPDTAKPQPKLSAAKAKPINSPLSNSQQNAGWEELQNEKGQIYYWNPDTKTTQWDPPSESDGSPLPLDVSAGGVGGGGVGGGNGDQPGIVANLQAVLMRQPPTMLFQHLQEYKESLDDDEEVTNALKLVHTLLGYLLQKDELGY